MAEPIETIIIRAQQDFDNVGGLNPMQIEIEGDRIINTLKRYKNVIYKITPLGLSFPATVTNDTNLIFIAAKELNGVKKSILNNKAYNLLAIIDQNKINNNSHLCFRFATRTFNDLTSFSIFLQDDRNKKIEFKSGEKKISIFNF